jgi:hypothetical protein
LTPTESNQNLTNIPPLDGLGEQQDEARCSLTKVIKNDIPLAISDLQSAHRKVEHHEITPRALARIGLHVRSLGDSHQS